jgi:hypothetical protein
MNLRWPALILLTALFFYGRTLNSPPPPKLPAVSSAFLAPVLIVFSCDLVFPLRDVSDIHLTFCFP